MQIEGQLGGRAGRMRRRWPRTAPGFALALVLAFPLASVARADPVEIPGTPLRVWADETGRMQVRPAGAGTGFWAPGASDAPDAGFWVRVRAGTRAGEEGDEWTTYGPGWVAGTGFTATGPVEVTGSGTAAAPYESAATFTAGPLEIRQMLAYVDGTREVQARYALRATGEVPVQFEAWTGGDLAVSGSDAGTGTLTGDPGERTVTARNPAAGGFAAADEAGGTPWSHVFEGSVDAIRAAILSGENPEDGASADVLDNGIALSWDDTAAPDAPVVLTTRWRFGSPAQLVVDAPPDGTAPAPTHTVRVALTEDGVARAGETVRWRVTGANEKDEAAASTGRAGTAELTWPGTEAGTDTVLAYADLDGSGEQSSGEPVLEQTYAWVAEPTPTETTPPPTVTEPPPEPTLTSPTTTVPPPVPTETATVPTETTPPPEPTGPTPTETAPTPTATTPRPAATTPTTTQRVPPSGPTPPAPATPQVFAAPSSVAVGPDTDGDGVADAADGCPAAADPGQADADRDGIGDACDANDASAGPKPGRTVVIRLTGGTVMVRYPAGTTPPRALRAAANANGYLPLEGAWSVPVGVAIDAAGGTVRLTAAKGTRSAGSQVGEFFQGAFVVRQERAAKTTTDLVLTGGSFRRCASDAAARLSTRKVRSLWGKDAGGRFRTVGKYSAGTVRGTRWLTTDRCDGTVTTVTEGKVAVRDSARRRTVLVMAGQSYLARSRAAAAQAEAEDAMARTRVGRTR